MFPPWQHALSPLTKCACCSCLFSFPFLFSYQVQQHFLPSVMILHPLFLVYVPLIHCPFFSQRTVQTLFGILCKDFTSQPRSISTHTFLLQTFQRWSSHHVHSFHSHSHSHILILFLPFLKSVLPPLIHMYNSMGFGVLPDQWVLSVPVTGTTEGDVDESQWLWW